jgi:hypothetical protein
MKRSLLPLLFVIGLISLTSCKKEQTTGLEFTATMEECTDVRNGKTVLNGEYLHWTTDDQVRIYGNGWSDFAVTPLSPATNARFTAIEGGSLEQSSTYRAYYPSTLTTDGVTITLPTTQTSVDGTLRDFPMYTESTTQQLAFKNLCGVLKLNLQKTGVTVTSIKLTMGSPINGTYTVSTTNGVPELSLQSGSGSNTTTLECNQSINSAHDFYIYLPEGTYSGLTLEITASDGTVCTKGPATSNVVIERSKYSTLTLGGDNLTFTRPTGTKSGFFTINENGAQVWFSQGNLQYYQGSQTWHFADEQYYFVGSGNRNIGSNAYNGPIDLFGWSTGHNPTVYASNWSYPSPFEDWGDNPIDNGGNTPYMWRTLTAAEWTYLFRTRATNTNLGTTNARYVAANVNSINGVILFPDNYTHPSGITSPSYINGTANGWSSNNYSSTDWSAMEAAGAVFLPAAGNRSGTTLSNIGSICQYWSSDEYDGTRARLLGFTNINLFTPNTNSIARSTGCSVRLVMDYN